MSDLEYLNERISNLSEGVSKMFSNEKIEVNKKFLQLILDYLIELKTYKEKEMLSQYNSKTNEVKHKHGHWKLLDECANAGVYCSICSKKVYKTDYANQKIKSKYCPNCGSIMDEEYERL